jgi:hypothetical protein
MIAFANSLEGASRFGNPNGATSMPLRDTLQTILADYADAKANPFKGHPLEISSATRPLTRFWPPWASMELVFSLRAALGLGTGLRCLGSQSTPLKDAVEVGEVTFLIFPARTHLLADSSPPAGNRCVMASAFPRMRQRQLDTVAFP